MTLIWCHACRAQAAHLVCEEGVGALVQEELNTVRVPAGSMEWLAL